MSGWRSATASFLEVFVSHNLLLQPKGFLPENTVHLQNQRVFYDLIERVFRKLYTGPPYMIQASGGKLPWNRDGHSSRTLKSSIRGSTLFSSQSLNRKGETLFLWERKQTADQQQMSGWRSATVSFLEVFVSHDMFLQPKGFLPENTVHLQNQRVFYDLIERVFRKLYTGPHYMIQASGGKLPWNRDGHSSRTLKSSIRGSTLFSSQSLNRKGETLFLWERKQTADQQQMSGWRSATVSFLEVFVSHDMFLQPKGFLPENTVHLQNQRVFYDLIERVFRKLYTGPHYMIQASGGKLPWNRDGHSSRTLKSSIRGSTLFSSQSLNRRSETLFWVGKDTNL